jgi:hypothetical protein
VLSDSKHGGRHISGCTGVPQMVKEMSTDLLAAQHTVETRCGVSLT